MINFNDNVFDDLCVRAFIVCTLLVIICAEAFKVKPLEIGTSGTIPFDHVKNDPEIRVVQWYKSWRSDAFETGDPSLASWANGATRSLPNYHIENTTLSLVIDNVTLKDEGLYKCFVARGDLFTESNYYIRTVMYAFPRKDPEITLDIDSNRVNCTVEHVKPMIYPVFNFDWIPESTETYAVLNEDGTYTTSISCTLPRTKSAPRVDCSFSYLHYQGVGSLDLRVITTDSLMENITTVSPMCTPVTFAGDTECIASVFFIVSSTVVISIMLIQCILLRRKCHRAVQKCNRANESEDNESEDNEIQSAVFIRTEVITLDCVGATEVEEIIFSQTLI